MKRKIGYWSMATNISAKSDLHMVCQENLGEEESFYFLNEGHLRNNARLLRSFFMPDDPRARPSYAVKANPHERIIEILSEEGINSFDCVSINEIDLVQKHVRTPNIWFNNPTKGKKKINNSKQRGVHHLTADNWNEINNIISAYTKDAELEIAVRMQTKNEAALINLSKKYGASPHATVEMLQFLIDQNIRPGISVHTGSQNFSVDSYTQSIEQIAQIIGYVSEKLCTLNMGGGIPVNIDLPYEKNADTFQSYLETITSALKKNIDLILRKDRDETKIIIEIGRALIGSVVDLVIWISNIERTHVDDQFLKSINDEEIRNKIIDNGKRIRVITMDDGIFTSFSDAKIHAWKYHFEAIAKDGRQLSSRNVPYLLHGRTCDSGDTLPYPVLLPEDMRPSDYLHVPNAGAYMSSQASGFNGLNAHPYVFYNS